MPSPILSSYISEERDGWHWTLWKDAVVIAKGRAADLPRARTQLIQSSIEHLALNDDPSRSERKLEVNDDGL